MSQELGSVTNAQLTSSGSVLQQPHVDLRPRQHHIAHHTATDEHVLHRRQMGVLGQVKHFDIVELDVQVLVDRFQDAADANVILEFNGDRLVGQGFEEAVMQPASAAIPITQACALRCDLPEEKHGCGG